MTEERYSRDTRGLELIAEDGGTPVYIDLFSPGNDKHRHVLVIGMNRSGKSVIVAGIMIQATLHRARSDFFPAAFSSISL